MAHTVMTHDEFKAYLKSKDIVIEKITETKVYIHFDLPGYPSPQEPPVDRNLLPVEAMDAKYNLRGDWKDGIGESFKEAIIEHKKIPCIKMIREHTGLGLKEAKDLYEKYENIWRSFFLEGNNNDGGLSTISR